ncbi:hypothetical protein CDAR_179761 [Caerostris darwini]|uniref:Uncharacterized protein n=1 Tax=Caerostris darwini TaxID=1538125 RepID=A0AAV4RLA5_9ARAC|nr:hypothetical protein CDAR_179761 [Caerostris darwini]
MQVFQANPDGKLDIHDCLAPTTYATITHNRSLKYHQPISLFPTHFPTANRAFIASRTLTVSVQARIRLNFRKALQPLDDKLHSIGPI